MHGMTIAHPPLDRSLPLRERKKLRTRRALADAALRLFAEKGFDATTLEELADEAEVSKSTFFRFFPAKEAAAIEAETELWTAYLAALGDRDLSGPVLRELHQTLAAAAAGLDPGWDERFVATRRLIAAENALLSYVEHYRAGRKHHLSVQKPSVSAPWQSPRPPPAAWRPASGSATGGRGAARRSSRAWPAPSSPPPPAWISPHPGSPPQTAEPERSRPMALG